MMTKKKNKGAEQIKKILKDGVIKDVRAFFQFDSKTEPSEVILRFNIWVRYFYPNVFKSKDAPFHHIIDISNLQAYRGAYVAFVDVAFRDSAKTTRTKFFTAFTMGNDKDKSKGLIKILCKENSNSKQFVTDIYNILIAKKHAHYYPEMFTKTREKRQDSMSVFMTATGIKVESGTVGVDQRGDQVFSEDEVKRPDLVIYDDFETRKTLRSAVETKSIWDNMEEARTGLAKGGSSIYLCNYISESGNVHKLIKKYSKREDSRVLIVPIKDKEGKVAWDRYTPEEVEQKLNDAEDPDGEYMCNPVAGFDVFIDRDILNKQENKQPIKTVAGFKMFHEYNPAHRLAGGHDIAGGVGLDSSASVFIDFSTVPAKVVATYANNRIIPEDFGHEIIREAAFFGNPIVAPERNYGTDAILVLKQSYDGEIYKSIRKKTAVNDTDRLEYGWHTNTLTKPEMLHGLKKAVEEGLLELSDEALIDEAKSYTRNDLMDRQTDPRLTTRHFDLLIACAIAFSMCNEAEVADDDDYDDVDYNEESLEPLFDEIGS
jgi:hypothetical protein